MCKVLGVNIVALTFEYDLIVLDFFWIYIIVGFFKTFSSLLMCVLKIVSILKKIKSNNVLELNSINYHYR